MLNMGKCKSEFSYLSFEESLEIAEVLIFELKGMFFSKILPNRCSAFPVIPAYLLVLLTLDLVRAP